MLTDIEIEKHRIAACDSGPLHFSAAMRFARAMEAEVRKDDESLIRQMLEALESVNQAMPFPVASAAITAARERIKE